MSQGPPDLDELLAGIAALVDEREEEREDDPGEGNFRCEACNACFNCRFCTGCDSCEDCTYCEDSVDCVSCTQSKRCVSCIKGSYLEDCRGCEGSRYLALCVDCKDCVHCLACVGLEGAEYHVLNEKVSKKEFYKILNRMREDLDARVELGWRPEIIGLASEALEDDEEAEAAPVDHDEEAEAFLRRPRRDAPSDERRAEFVNRAAQAGSHGAERGNVDDEARADFDDPQGRSGFDHERSPVRFETDPRELASRRSVFDSRSASGDDSALWNDEPSLRDEASVRARSQAPGDASPSGAGISRGRRPTNPAPSRSPAASRHRPEASASDLWRDQAEAERRHVGGGVASPSRGSEPSARDSRSSARTGTGTGSASGSGSALIGRPPARAREITGVHSHEVSRPTASTNSGREVVSANASRSRRSRSAADAPDPFGDDSLGIGSIEPSAPHTSAQQDKGSGEKGPAPASRARASEPARHSSSSEAGPSLERRSASSRAPGLPQAQAHTKREQEARAPTGGLRRGRPPARKP